MKTKTDIVSAPKGIAANRDYIRMYCTVTRPYEGFRHPDWMAPESTVRGRENDSLVRPGYIYPLLPSFSGGYGIFRRFTL
jgi:hypothetical protein